MSHPTTRVLAVLELLQSHGQISGAELARRVEVDPRTLRRYIAMLEEMGIPITTEQGRYGGYRLVPGFKLPPMMFTEEEAQALSLGLLAARGLGLSDAAPAIESVQAKLDRVLPSAPKRTLSALRESVALQTGDARTNADARLLRILGESAQSRLAVALRYHAADGAPTSREFDASEYLSRAMATMPRAIPVELWLDTDLDTARREVPHALGVPEADANGVSVKGSTDELDWYARELMRLPFRFEVRAPQALRTTLGRLAGELARRFAAW